MITFYKTRSALNGVSFFQKKIRKAMVSIAFRIFLKVFANFLFLFKTHL